jgi:hypothetical protein
MRTLEKYYETEDADNYAFTMNIKKDEEFDKLEKERFLLE